jgi:hypothetical protein
MPTKKDEIAKKLIDWHFEVEPEITEVYRLIALNEEDAREPIKLLEVSEATFTVGRVMPFGFGPTVEFPYNTVIATITPEEMEQVRRQEIPLPEGWNLGASVLYPASDYKSQESRRWRRSRGIVHSMFVPYSKHKPLFGSRRKLGVS